MFFPGLDGHGRTWLKSFNTGQFSAFKLSDCGAFKIIKNGTKLGLIPWKLNAENPLFYFCVGVWVGGQDPKNFSRISKMRQKVPYLSVSILVGDREK